MRMHKQRETYAPYAYDATWMIIYAYDWAFTHADISDASDISRGLRRLSDTSATTDYNVTPVLDTHSRDIVFIV